MSQRDDTAPPQDNLPVEEGGDAYHSRIVIKPDGEVLIENLSMDLIELAEMLDPDSPVACALPGEDDEDDEDDD
jgi:hypothetical protein